MVVMVSGQLLEIVQKLVMEVCSSEIDSVMTLHQQMVEIIVRIMEKLMNREHAILKLVQVCLVFNYC